MFGLSNLRLGIYAALGIVLLATLGAAKWQHHRAQVATARAEQAEAALDTAVSANEGNVSTIAKLEAAVSQWKEMAALANEDLAGYAATAKQSAADLEALRREYRRLRANDSTPACIAVLRTDISGPCPSVDLGLRKLTEGCHRNPHGGDPCSDPEAAATGTR